MTARIRRPIVALLMLALAAACAPKNDLKDKPPPLGKFLLGLNLVVTDGMQKGPVSRDATPDQWQAALKQAMQDRFGRYDGTDYYDFAITVKGYALAPPGIPVLLSPKSVLIIDVLIWYDATKTLLDPKPKQFIVFEGTSPDTIIGSGLTRTKAEQLHLLSYNAAKQVEDWLLKHPEWFPATGAPVPEAAAGAPAPAAGTAAAPVSTKPLPKPGK